MKLNKILTYSAFLAMGILPAGCSLDGPLPSDDLEPGKLNLVLKMAVNPGKSASYAGLRNIVSPSATRADDYTYEGTSGTYEGVRSLRIIIVRLIVDKENAGSAPKEVVEHNAYYLFPDSQIIWDAEKEYEYIVEGGETKRIYLIANEASVGEEFVKTLEAMTVGSDFIKGELDNEMIKSTDGKPYIDNGSGSGRRFIPMTEVFDAKIPNRGINQDLKYKLEHALFLTRALSKFSFSVKVEDSAADYGINGMKITSIRISGKNNTGCFTDEAWLFPHGLVSPDGTSQIAGGAVYTPDKYGPSTEALNGKAITSFSTPGDAKANYTWTFTPESFGIPGKKANTDLKNTFEPFAYFLESPAKEFYVTLTAESNGLEQTFGPKQLPNLPYFARNTHAQIQFTFSGYDMNAEVTVFPYTGVNLNPEFGFSAPETDMLTIAPTMELNMPTQGLLRADYTSSVGNKIDNIIWVSSDASIVLLQPEDNDPDPESQLYIRPSESVNIPVDERVKVIPQKAGTTYVTAYTQNGLVARCRVTVK